ncbi:DnaJ domain-containing protein [sulfur-oxidizing endosymbiont of Gigantopelta aegis]|uniref:DnaJ domain-containing protein n=1 Tax=sulfur-oxidizing endosymbiont of Gigantopelta aegis TaxID=2794934 RepID=UPI0018DCC49F
MSKKDYYKILDVNRNASDADIKKQYRRLARKFHPDVSKVKNSEAKFKEINEAYDVLKDKTKRDNYDRFGSADGNPFQGGGGFTPPPGGAGQSGFGGFGQGSFNDIFDNMFTNSGVDNFMVRKIRSLANDVHRKGKIKMLSFPLIWKTHTMVLNGL